MIQSFSPRSGQAFGPVFPEASKVTIDAAVSRAAESSDYLMSLSDAGLSKMLSVMSAALRANSLELANVADKETALGIDRLTSEIARTAGQLDAFAEFVAAGDATEPVVHPEGHGRPDLRRMSVPLGVVAVFAASNFPFAFSVAGGDTASALAARCPVVVKAHPGHPQTSTQVLNVIHEALANDGYRTGILQLLHGRLEVSRMLVEHPRVAAVGFTGSTQGGSALTSIASRRPVPIPVYAEQGSVNPIVLGHSVLNRDLHNVGSVIGASIANGAGQFCTKPGIVFVPTMYRRSVAGEFQRAFSRTTPFHLLTAEISQRFEDQLASIEKLPDIQVWRGQAGDQGFTVAPAVIDCTLPQVQTHTELAQELFGPAVVVCGVDAPSDLAEAASAVGGSLTATVWGDIEDPWVEEFLHEFPPRAGRIIYQGVPTGVAVDSAMQHGGPFPASNNSQFTSVGLNAARRFQRPVTFQSFPEKILPTALQRPEPALVTAGGENA